MLPGADTEETLQRLRDENLSLRAEAEELRRELAVLRDRRDGGTEDLRLQFDRLREFDVSARGSSPISATSCGRP